MSKEKSVMYPSVTWMECEELIKKIDKYNGKLIEATTPNDANAGITDKNLSPGCKSG